MAISFLPGISLAAHLGGLVTGVALGALFPLYLNTSAAIRQIDGRLVDAARPRDGRDDRGGADAGAHRSVPAQVDDRGVMSFHLGTLQEMEGGAWDSATHQDGMALLDSLYRVYADGPELGIWTAVATSRSSTCRAALASSLASRSRVRTYAMVATVAAMSPKPTMTPRSFTH